MVSGRAAEAIDRDLLTLVDTWLDRLHDAAQNIVGSAAAATTVCHDVLESLHEHSDDSTDDNATTDHDTTGEVMLLAVRERALGHLDLHGWHPPSANGPVGEYGGGVGHGGATIRYRVVLARAAATVIGADSTSLLDLHVRHGVDAGALADAMRVTPDAATERLARLRGRLGDAIRAFTLWNEGRPSCPELNASLGDTDGFDTAAFDTGRFETGRFDIATSRAVDLHWRACAVCASEQQLLVDPAGLFLTAPLITVAPAVRARLLSVVAHPTTSWATSGTAATSSTAETNGAVAATSAAVDEPARLSDDEIAALWSSTVGIGATQPKPDDTEIDELWASTASDTEHSDAEIDELWASTASDAETRDAETSEIVPVATSAYLRVGTRKRTLLVAATVVLATGTGAAVLALRASDDASRTVVESPPRANPPDSEINTEINTGTDTSEPRVRSLAPLPPTTAPAATPTTTVAGAADAVPPPPPVPAPATTTTLRRSATTPAPTVAPSPAAPATTTAPTTPTTVAPTTATPTTIVDATAPNTTVESATTTAPPSSSAPTTAATTTTPPTTTPPTTTPPSTTPPSTAAPPTTATP